MDKATALQVFDALEKPRYLRHPLSVEQPMYNVRLDAGTETTLNERFYRLFVRVDGKPLGTTALDGILEHAREHGLTAVVENGGVELS